MNASDSELLQEFAREGSERAFTELMHRHVDLVYTAALRQVGLDVQAAEDVAQVVFTDMARKAHQLTRHPTLVGWLYSSTRYAAAQFRRSENRRLVRESTAQAMSQLLSANEPEPDWNQLRPVLDEAMHDLNDADRELVLLRYFEKRPLSEIGANLGLSENTARMRVERALDKLQGILARRGITSSASALGIVIGGRGVMATPKDVIGRIGSAALARSGPGVTRVASGKIPMAVAIVLLGVSGLLWKAPKLWNHSAATEVGSFATAGSKGMDTVDVADSGDLVGNGASKVASQVSTLKGDGSLELAKSPALILSFLTKNSGQAIPGVEVRCHGWQGAQLSSRSIAGTHLGEAVVRIAPGTTRLELTVIAEGFADTKLRWNPERGDVIPTDYTVRLEKAVLIGGSVLDPDGQPVAGAKVSWGHTLDGSEQKGIESQEFGLIEATTDIAGRWSLHRIGEAMLPRVRGGATHPDFQPSPDVNLARLPDDEQRLRQQAHVFHLKPAVVLRGVVVNEDDDPIGGANVLVGQLDWDGSRETKTEADGTFEVRGAAAGEIPVTAEADGYAAKSMRLTLTEVNEPVRLVLGRGTPLRLRVLSRTGAPVPQAYVYLNNMESGGLRAGTMTQLLQVSFTGRSDDEGRVVWNDAPPGIHQFDIHATGCMRTNQVSIPADGKEHVVILGSSLMVQGRVKDADTGQDLSQFVLRFGWPNQHPMPPGTNAGFSSIGRFAVQFSGGAYKHYIEEEILPGSSDQRCVMKCEADGYLSQVSRPLRYDEGIITWDVALVRASEIEVTVVDPAGRVAGGADIGLLNSGISLILRNGRIPNGYPGYPGSLRQADANGRVTLMVDPNVSRIVVAHPTGFVETDFAALKNNPFVLLKPWGRIEGGFQGPQNFSAGKLVAVSPINSQLGELIFDITATTDAGGRFVLSQVPPGPVTVNHLGVIDYGNGSTISEPVQTVEASVAPDETTQVTFGGGYRVVGRLRPPPTFSPPEGAYWYSALQTPSPETPQAIRDDPVALEKWVQTPEIQTLLRRVKRLSARIKPDGSFTAEFVPAGDYRFTAMLIPRIPRSSSNPQSQVPTLLTAKRDFTLPTEPGDGEIDLGVVVAEEPRHRP